MELTTNQIFIVGALATGITYALRLLADWFEVAPGRAALTVVLYAVAVVLGGVWTGAYLPAYTGDPAAWVGELVTMIGPIVTVATLIYNLLHARVFNPLAHKISGK